MNNARKVEPEQPAQQSQSSCTAEKAKVPVIPSVPPFSDLSLFIVTPHLVVLSCQENTLKFHSIVRCLSTVGRMSNTSKVEPEPEDEMSKIEERALMRQQARRLYLVCSRLSAKCISVYSF